MTTLDALQEPQRVGVFRQSRPFPRSVVLQTSHPSAFVLFGEEEYSGRAVRYGGRSEVGTGDETELDDTVNDQGEADGVLLFTQETQSTVDRVDGP